MTRDWQCGKADRVGGGEAWRQVWREGFVPELSTAALEALREGLVTDDPRLQQGATTTPPPLLSLMDWAVEAACALGYCGWRGEGLKTVGQVEEYFARLCYEADLRLGEPTACRHFLNWYDDTPREVVRRELLAEVELALAQRQAKPTPATAATAGSDPATGSDSVADNGSTIGSDLAAGSDSVAGSDPITFPVTLAAA
jgi:hypothetical protein